MKKNIRPWDVLSGIYYYKNSSLFSLETFRKTIKFPNIVTIYWSLAGLTSLLLGQHKQGLFRRISKSLQGPSLA
jgi:hypothetical protein